MPAREHLTPTTKTLPQFPHWAPVVLILGISVSGCGTLSPSVEASPINALPSPQAVGAASAVIIEHSPSAASFEEALPADRTTVRPLANPADWPDLWSRIRAGFRLAPTDRPEVEQYAQRFAEQRLLTNLAPRARRYLYLFVAEAEKRQLPTELALLPIIESGLNPHAVSPAKAVGLCQFIPATGRRFNLPQSTLIDRRRDVACMHSMYAYLEANATQFSGDWFLALASYNWGEGAVARAIERNRAAGLETDYFSLRMPAETRNYVPQLLALKRLIENPEAYGVAPLPNMPNRPSMICDAPITADIDVVIAARLAGISEAEFRGLNPGIRKEVIPRASHAEICLPPEARNRFIAALPTHRGRLSRWTTHTTSRDIPLTDLARRLGTTVKVIRAANDIPAGMRLRSGSTVLVPRQAGDGDIPAPIVENAVLSWEPDRPALRRTTVRIKRQISARDFAARHGVSIDALRRWNPSLKKTVRPGQTIVIFMPTQPARKTRPLRGAL